MTITKNNCTVLFECSCLFVYLSSYPNKISLSWYLVILTNYPKKYLPKFPTKKIPKSWILNPKKSFVPPRHLNSKVPPPPGVSLCHAPYFCHLYKIFDNFFMASASTGQLKWKNCEWQIRRVVTFVLTTPHLWGFFWSDEREAVKKVDKGGVKKC